MKSRTSIYIETLSVSAPIQQLLKSVKSAKMSVVSLLQRSGQMRLSAVLMLLAIALGSAPSAHAQLNLVYVEGNISNGSGNMVLGFSNDGAGNLTPLSGSPYLTGGFGVTGVFSDVQFDSDGELLTNSAGSLLFAVNGNSNTLSSFSVNSDGSLTATAGSPFSSGGQDPVSLAVKEHTYTNGDSLMVVVNKSSDPLQTGAPSYTTFEVSPSGSMTLNSGSTLSLPAGTSPGQVLTRPGARVQFFGVEFMNDKVVNYKASKAGILSEVSEDNAGNATLGGVLHPTRPAVYVGLPGINQISINKYDSAGNLSILRKISNPGVLVCWLAMNAAGTRLYSGETGSGSVTVYDTTNAGNPTQLQHFILSPSGSLPAHLKVDPTGKFLYVVDRVGSLHVLGIDANGMLSENHAPTNLGLPPGGIPMGLVVMTK
jgi:6-phosphogluconolactonase